MARTRNLGTTIREIAAQQTLDRLKPLLPEFGITRVANITGLDTVGIPVWTAIRPLSRSLSVSQGKGGTKELAMVSAIMESVEVFHAEQRQPRSRNDDLFKCNRDDSFISPHVLGVRSDAKLSRNASIAWAKGVDLLNGKTKWIPAELFDLDFSKRELAPIFLASSNGLASGNSRAEATVHGLCEVIERDQASFWFAEQENPSQAPPRRVRIDTIKEPVCKSLVEKCLSAGLTVFVWYISINIDVPVFACTIADPGRATDYPQFATGWGCHPVLSVALARAVTEAAQSRLTHISGLREDLTWSRYRQEFLSESDRNRAKLAEMHEQPATIDFANLASVPDKVSATTNNLVSHLLKRLEKAGLSNAIVVDLADNEIFSVVFVCVPQLEYKTPKASNLYMPGHRMREFTTPRKS